MKTLRKVKITVEYVEIMPYFKDMVQDVVYISEKYHISIHKCLCGNCGEKTVLPLNHENKITGWDLIKNIDGTISFVPSIGNFQFPCNSHYILTDNVANFV